MQENIRGIYDALQGASAYTSSNIDAAENPLLSSFSYHMEKATKSIMLDGNEIIVSAESPISKELEVIDGYYQVPDKTALSFQGDGTLDYGLKFLGNGMIRGSSSETTFVSATIDQPLIKSDFSLPIQNISFVVTGSGQKIFELGGNGVNNAHDWYFLNLYGDADFGTIGDVSNWLIFGCAFFNTGNGIVIDGTMGTGAINQSILSGQSTVLTITENATITRRFRATYSSIIAPTNGLNVSTSASIPVEGYILDTINFAGGGNFIIGVQHDDNKSKFSECRGIKNSSSVGGLYMQNNATPTAIPQATTYYKITGTTTALAENQKFDVSNNRVTYKGALSNTFELRGTATVTGNANNVIGVSVFKNGLESTGFEVRSTLNSGGRAENVAFFWVGELQQDDYLELYIENYTGANAITVVDLFYMAGVLK